MATAVVTFNAEDGVTVGCYLERDSIAGRRPVGAPVTSSTVSNRTVTFTGVEYFVPYVAVDDSGRLVRFTPEPVLDIGPAELADVLTRLSALETHVALTTTAHGGVVGTGDSRLSDARTPVSHATSHAPGGTDSMAVDAAAATGSLRTLGAGATQAVAGTDARFPTSDQKAALVGSQGSPSASNVLVTNVDARLFAISVKAQPYNAVGDGTTNDQAAIQAAINAANCRPVHLPPGTYRINSPLRLKPSTYLFGTESPQWMYPEWSIKTQIVAGSGFSGAALIEAYEPSITGDASPVNGCTLEHLFLNCNGLAPRAVYARGDARDYTLRDVKAIGFTSAGFQLEGNGSNPCQEWNFWHCHAYGSGVGFLIQARSYDHRLIGCVAHTCTGDGYQVVGGTGGAASIEFIGCRSEWNGGHGCLLYGPSGSSGIGKIGLHGCVTDSNEQNGVYVEHNVANGGPVLIANHYSNRDGNNGGSGGRAGIRIHNCGEPVIVSGVAQRIGQNDGGGGIFRPTYGIDVTSLTTHCLLGPGNLSGVTAGYHADGTVGQVVKFGSGLFLEANNGTPTYQPPSPS
jgi:Pectate lyase superfamily protein